MKTDSDLEVGFWELINRSRVTGYPEVVPTKAGYSTITSGLATIRSKHAKKEVSRWVDKAQGWGQDLLSRSPPGAAFPDQFTRVPTQHNDRRS